MVQQVFQAIGKVGRRINAAAVLTEPMLGSDAVTITRDQILEWAMEGRLYHAQQGNAATLVDFVETAYDEDQPQFALLVPSAKIVVPVYLSLTHQDQAGTDQHVIWSLTTNDIGNGSSSALTISSMRSDNPRASQCVARSLYTGNATAATGLFEFQRWVDPFAANTGRPNPKYTWDIKSASNIPVIVGPGTLQMHAIATGDGGEGFGEYVWAEFDKADYPAL